jgi:hypothetical protein
LGQFKSGANPLKDKEAAWPADKVERRPVEALVPYAKNARTHSPAQVEQIAASIREWGWTVPVLLDEADGIIAGHGRVLAAKTLGLGKSLNGRPRLVSGQACGLRIPERRVARLAKELARRTSQATSTSKREDHTPSLNWQSALSPRETLLLEHHVF